MSDTAPPTSSALRQSVLSSKLLNFANYEDLGIMKTCKAQSRWLVCLPGPAQGFLLVISQGRPEVEPICIPVAGSPPADQHKL